MLSDGRPRHSVHVKLPTDKASKSVKPTYCDMMPESRNSKVRKDVHC
jgi:hypothetical protein